MARPRVSRRVVLSAVAVLLSAVTVAAASAAPDGVFPGVASQRFIGYAQQTTTLLNRDSCGSVAFGNNPSTGNPRVLWTCRDTQGLSGKEKLGSGFVSSTASWTDVTNWGQKAKTSNPSNTNPQQPVGPLYQGSNVPNITQYGAVLNQGSFYPPGPNECGSTGFCSDGTRYALWPNQPPAVTHTGSDGSVRAWTFVPNSHFNGLASVGPPVTIALYRVTYTPTSTTGVNDMPTVTLMAESFWDTSKEPQYGADGTLVGASGNYLFLYGKSDTGVSLARVPVTSVSDKTQYSYWIDSTQSWSSTNPGRNGASTSIPNLQAQYQGTFYWSAAWGVYVWIGQALMRWRDHSSALEYSF